MTFFCVCDILDTVGDNMKKRKIVVSSIIVSVLLVGIIASTYAYFQAVVSSGSTSVATVNAKTLDSLVFSDCANLSITANQDNFGLGKGDLTATSTCTVKLTANNNSSASYNYKTFFNKISDEFENTLPALNTDEDAVKSSNLFGTFTSIQQNGPDTGVSLTYNTDTRTFIINGKLSSYATWDILQGSPSGTGIDIYDVTLPAGTYYTFYMPKNVSLVGVSSSGETTLASNTTNSFTLSQSTTFTSYKVLAVTATTYNNDVIYPMICKTPGLTEYIPIGYVHSDIILNIKKNGSYIIQNKGVANYPINYNENDTSSSNMINTNTITAEAGKTTIDTWEISVTLKNYDFNQDINAGKNFSGKLRFTKS